METDAQPTIEEQARRLAKDNRDTEPKIKDIFWFKADHEIRLVEVDDSTVPSVSGEIEPFYFDPAPSEGLPAPSVIAIIRSNEVGKLDLPKEWGTWQDAEKI